MTDLRKAAEMALNALKISTPVYSPHKFTQALKALEAALAQPEQEPFKPDWVSYRQGVADGAAQTEQEEPLPLVDIGVDVTPEGTHVVACYNRPDAVQEMFYSQFHPLAKPEQSKYSDIVSDGGLDPRNKFDAQPKQEPVAWIGNADFVKGQFVEGRVRRVWWECNTGVGQPLYTEPPRKEWVGLTDEDINKAWEWAQKSSPYGVTRIETFAKSIEAKIKEKNEH